MRDCQECQKTANTHKRVSRYDLGNDVIIYLFTPRDWIPFEAHQTLGKFMQECGKNITIKLLEEMVANV